MLPEVIENMIIDMASHSDHNDKFKYCLDELKIRCIQREYMKSKKVYSNNATRYNQYGEQMTISYYEYMINVHDSFSLKEHPYNDDVCINYTTKEKFETLIKCKCCDRHQHRRPDEVFSDESLYMTKLVKESKLDEPEHTSHISHISCKCPCRHISREIQKIYHAESFESLITDEIYYLNNKSNKLHDKCMEINTKKERIIRDYRSVMKKMNNAFINGNSADSDYQSMKELFIGLRNERNELIDKFERYWRKYIRVVQKLGDTEDML